VKQDKKILPTADPEQVELKLEPIKVPDISKETKPVPKALWLDARKRYVEMLEDSFRNEYQQRLVPLDTRRWNPRTRIVCAACIGEGQSIQEAAECSLRRYYPLEVSEDESTAREEAAAYRKRGRWG
jgi:hypothetical protein